MKLKREKTKPVEDKPHNQSRAAIINKRKELMKELHDSVDYNNLKFEYVDKKNDHVSFYEYRNSKELFNVIKDNQIRFDDVIKKQEEFLYKLNNIKIGKKNIWTKRDN